MALPLDIHRVGDIAGFGWDALPQAPLPSDRSDVLRYLVTAAGRTTMLDADVPPVGQVEGVNTVAALFATVSARPPAP